MDVIDYSIRYQYSFLNNSEKKLYRDIVEAISDLKATYNSTFTNVERLNEIFNFVCEDFPEIFYIDKKIRYSYNEISSTLFFSYTSEKKEIRQMVYELNENVEKILKEANRYPNTFEKVLYIYDFLITRTKYDMQLYEFKTGSVYGYTAYGALVNHIAVCSGYSSAFQLLLNGLGIKCIRVSNETHSWCCGELENKWYFFDPTWDAPVSDRSSSYGVINHNYFAVKTSEILLDHNFPQTKNLPVCVSNDYDYFITKNLYFSALEEEDMDRLIGLLRKNLSNAVTLKFASTFLCNQAENKLFHKNRIWDAYNGGISYVKNKKTITIIPK